MQEHFNFTDDEFKNLLDKKVTIQHFFELAKDFDFSGTQIEFGFINLFYYVDEKGNFFEKPDFPKKLICRAVFEKLEQNQKMQLIEYIGAKEEKEF
jgi:hypothetical protein